MHLAGGVLPVQLVSDHFLAGYEISIKTKIIGFNESMIKSSWDFHRDEYAHALHVTYVGAVAAASILNPHNTCSLFKMAVQQNS